MICHIWCIFIECTLHRIWLSVVIDAGINIFYVEYGEFYTNSWLNDFFL